MLRKDRSDFQIWLKINLVRLLSDSIEDLPEKILERYLSLKNITGILLSTNGGLAYPEEIEEHLSVLSKFLQYLQ